MPSPNRDLYKPKGGKMLDSDDQVFDLTAWIKSVGVSILTAFKIKNVAGTLINPAKRELQEDIIAKMPTLEANGGVPVNIQDQTSAPVDIFFQQAKTGVISTVATETAEDDLTLELADASNFTVGDYLGMFRVAGSEFYFGEILSKNVNQVTLDTPIDFAFPVGSVVIGSSRELNVDGSSTTQVYDVRGGGTEEIDITRIIIKMETSGVPDYSKFGDLTKLVKGIVLRRNNGTMNNIFNVKTNGELANLTFDLDVLQASNPAQGINGLVCRMTFAGQDKHGVAIRLALGDALELLIQDDLRAIDSFRIIAQGHIVTDS